MIEGLVIDLKTQEIAINVNKKAILPRTAPMKILAIKMDKNRKEEEEFASNAKSKVIWHEIVLELMKEWWTKMTNTNHELKILLIIGVIMDLAVFKMGNRTQIMLSKVSKMGKIIQIILKKMKIEAIIKGEVIINVRTDSIKTKINYQTGAECIILLRDMNSASLVVKKIILTMDPKWVIVWIDRYIALKITMKWKSKNPSLKEVNLDNRKEHFREKEALLNLQVRPKEFLEKEAPHYLNLQKPKGSITKLSQLKKIISNKDSRSQDKTRWAVVVAVASKNHLQEQTQLLLGQILQFLEQILLHEREALQWNLIDWSSKNYNS